MPLYGAAISEASVNASYKWANGSLKVPILILGYIDSSIKLLTKMSV